jgi:hypothetical protein
MTLFELYLWFCFVTVSLVGLWGIFLGFSWVLIYLIEMTMKHFKIWKLFVAFLRKAQEK